MPYILYHKRSTFGTILFIYLPVSDLCTLPTQTNAASRVYYWYLDSDHTNGYTNTLRYNNMAGGLANTTIVWG